MYQNRRKYIGLVASLIVIMLTCIGCSGKDAVMPYGSSDYENGEWTVDALVTHLEELGFDNIDIEEDKSRYVREVSLNVRVEDTESDSWFTEYTDFIKGEPVKSWRDVKIEVTHPIPVMTIENTPELVDILPLRSGTEEDFEEWKSFMEEHNGEYIEFNGTVLDVYDEFWYISGISLDISFEGYENIDFGWSGIEPNDIGYDNDYSLGCLPKGTPAYCVVKIVYSEAEGFYELDSLDIIR